MQLIRNPDLVTAEMDGDLVMLSIERGTYFGLSGIAPSIWEMLETPCSREELLVALLERFDVSQATLRADMDEFISDMIDKGLLREA